jgi:hypothetical protein
VNLTAGAFSSEVETGSRQENASNQDSRAPFRFNRNGKGPGGEASANLITLNSAANQPVLEVQASGVAGDRLCKIGRTDRLGCSVAGQFSTERSDPCAPWVKRVTLTARPALPGYP